METNLLTKAVEFVSTYWPVITSFIGSFALLSTLTPNKSDDKIVEALLKLVNFFAGNFGKSKNLDE